MTKEQLRAARALLDWSRDELQKRSLVSHRAIQYFEAGEREMTAANIAALRAVLEKAGVVFLDNGNEGPGVRLKPSRKGKAR
jgi:transcriptional regulator with XRE-family HTH domain